MPLLTVRQSLAIDVGCAKWEIPVATSLVNFVTKGGFSLTVTYRGYTLNVCGADTEPSPMRNKNKKDQSSR